MKKVVQQRQTGFTLIELLIVIVLLGFLSITGLSMFQGSIKRGRDARRKTDLSQIAKALEMYANDSITGYPESKFNAVETGKIVGCVGTLPTACEWGGVWSRGSIYMQKLPKDPGSGSYCYQKTTKGYMLYAKLERTEDPDYNSDPNLKCPAITGEKYTYFIYSTNITPTPVP